ncbi:hypothetical protein A1I_00435 [Rickettsia bellii OSU 85-389]|uniref:hypothetical protein n=1 Tax=Rickettsia bellii TaxID=33990 RepID=UPI0000DB0D99|nr:hypothetical protein [Rickettsia bellii]ABV78493.1 hypothetical protein A1I_00435 [Rickettsia bellii OSU 85-389]
MLLYDHFPATLEIHSIILSPRGSTNSTGQLLKKNVIFYSGVGDLICHSRIGGNPVKLHKNSKIFKIKSLGYLALFWIPAVAKNDVE